MYEKVGSSYSREGRFEPMTISSSGPKVPYLFFAEDCLLFVKAKSSQLRLVKQTLDVFLLAEVRFKIYTYKSRILASNNVSRAKTTKFEGILGFPNTHRIEKYVGYLRNQILLSFLTKFKGG